MNDTKPIKIETGLVRETVPAPGRARRLWRSLARIILAVVIGFSLIFGGLLFFLQRHLYYFPRPYEYAELRMIVGKEARAVPYTTSAGKQVAYYVSPGASGAHSADANRPDAIRPDSVITPPARLWVLFGGNGSRALDWLDLIEQHPDPAAGYLLVDYPGYGQCEGKPSRGGIQESSEAALAALVREMAVAPGVLERDLNVLGHSIGAATGLEFAAHHPVRRVVLLSPFTSLYDTVRFHVGRPICWLLRDRYDNRVRLAELVRHAPRPAVTIIHGENDEVVPVTMGRELAGRTPDWIAYHEIKGGDHNSVVSTIGPEVLAAMRPDVL